MVTHAASNGKRAIVIGTGVSGSGMAAQPPPDRLDRQGHSGSANTAGQSINQVGLLRLPHETPITGLFMAGDYAGPARGVGAELACQSGLYCADLVANHLALGIMNW